MATEKRRDPKLARIGHLSLPEIKKLSQEVGGGAFTKFGRHERVFRYLAEHPGLLPDQVDVLVVGAGAQPPLELELDSSPKSRDSKHFTYSFEPFELANSLEHAGKDYAITVADKNPAVVRLINGQRFLLTSDSQASKAYFDDFFPGGLAVDFPEERMRDLVKNQRLLGAFQFRNGRPPTAIRYQRIPDDVRSRIQAQTANLHDIGAWGKDSRYDLVWMMNLPLPQAPTESRIQAVIARGGVLVTNSPGLRDIGETHPGWKKVKTFRDPGGVDTAILRRVSPRR